MYWKALYVYADDFEDGIKIFYSNNDICINDLKKDRLLDNDMLIIDIDTFNSQEYKQLSITRDVVGPELLSKVLIATDRIEDLVAFFIYNYYGDIEEFEIEKIIIHL